MWRVRGHVPPWRLWRPLSGRLAGAQFRFGGQGPAVADDIGNRMGGAGSWGEVGSAIFAKKIAFGAEKG